MNSQSLKRQSFRISHAEQILSPIELRGPTAQQTLFSLPVAAQPAVVNEHDDRLTMRSTATLKLHPSVLKLKLKPSEERLLALEKSGDAIFKEPILITQDSLIVDGYARWFLARRQKREMLLCVKLQLSEQQALQRILQNHFPRKRLNDYLRIVLALDLESWFGGRARANQSTGGKGKGSSKLTEDRRIDCRKEIAAAAGVSTGNVTKVKQIRRSEVADEVMEALRLSEISIHWAWTLRKLPVREQPDAMKKRRSIRCSNQRIRKLLSKDMPGSSQVEEALRHIRQSITELRNMLGMDGIWKPMDDSISIIERVLFIDRSDADAYQTDPRADTGQHAEILGQSTNQTGGPQQLLESA